MLCLVQRIGTPLRKSGLDPNVNQVRLIYNNNYMYKDVRQFSIPIACLFSCAKFQVFSFPSCFVVETLKLKFSVKFAEFSSKRMSCTYTLTVIKLALPGWLQVTITPASLLMYTDYVTVIIYARSSSLCGPEYWITYPIYRLDSKCLWIMQFSYIHPIT